LPAAIPYPQDTQGRPMPLLAQINFEEMPHLEGFPRTGILQFYMAATDWEMSEDYKVLFFQPQANEILHTDFSFLTEELYEEYPVTVPHRLRFSLQDDFGNSEDHNLPVNFNGLSFFEFADTLSDEEKKQLNDFFDGAGNKLGGYAYFTQSDPRDCEADRIDDVQLLQIDSNNKHIMWGDNGLGHLFIHPDDLKAGRLEKAWFYWDCY